MYFLGCLDRYKELTDICSYFSRNCTFEHLVSLYAIHLVYKLAKQVH